MLSLKTDRTLIRAGARSARYAMASITAPDAPARRERLPVNVALILDRSGSMDGERKFALAREAVAHALRLLQPEDRFALVVFDNAVDVLVPSTPATPEARREAERALAAIGPRGSTDLSGGWLRGCDEIAQHLTGEGIARALLLTDGLANAGIQDRESLAHHAGELRRRGIATTTFGVGADFDERLLRDMAHEGGGNFYFIETPAQIPDLVTSELGEALEVVVREAALVVMLPPGARAEPLNRFRHRPIRGDRDGIRIELGDLVSGQTVDAVVRVQFGEHEPDIEQRVEVALVGNGGGEALDAGTLTWTTASHARNDVQPRDRVVDRAVARLYVARATAEATEANRNGDFDHARRVLERTARRIRAYAGSDRELRNEARRLEARISEFVDTPMSAMTLKASLFVAESMAKGRSVDGRAQRRPPR